MPAHPSVDTTRISQEDFKSLANEVMRHVLDREITFTTLRRR
jgi:hypothetical protein